jgi:D-glycero-D-manno-heptose 1,7-bisphosphate phosphatase
VIAEEVGYLNHLSRFRMFPFAGSAIRRLNDTGLAVFVLTNQSGVARGYFPESFVGDVHDHMRRELLAQGAKLDGIYYCPHGATDGCDCRKPAIGMIKRAEREHHLDLRRSFVVGDRYLDMQMAFSAGCKAVYVRTGWGLGEETWQSKQWPRQPDVILDNLDRAVDWIWGHTE